MAHRGRGAAHSYKEREPMQSSDLLRLTVQNPFRQTFYKSGYQFLSEVFSTFAEGTYKELNESFLKVSEEYKYSQNFIGLEELKKIGKILKEEYYMEEYKSLLEFLKSIKGIGAQSSLTNKKVLTPNIIKAVEKEYLASYKKILVSNSLAYVEVN